jgi:ABC-type phosphate transport system ATPase subunit
LKDVGNGNTFKMGLSSINAMDEVSSADASVSTDPNDAATFTVRQADGQLSNSTDVVYTTAQLFEAGVSDNIVFAFRVNAKNDDIKLSNLTFS